MVSGTSAGAGLADRRRTGAAASRPSRTLAASEANRADRRRSRVQARRMSGTEGRSLAPRAAITPHSPSMMRARRSDRQIAECGTVNNVNKIRTPNHARYKDNLFALWPNRPWWRPGRLGRGLGAAQGGAAAAFPEWPVTASIRTSTSTRRRLWRKRNGSSRDAPRPSSAIMVS
jgi:hypothetical protein